MSSQREQLNEMKKFMSIAEEADGRPYICVHAKKGRYECYATSSYGAAKKAAEHWKLKSTAGIDAHLADVGHSTQFVGEGDAEGKEFIDDYESKIADNNPCMYCDGGDESCEVCHGEDEMFENDNQTQGQYDVLLQDGEGEDSYLATNVSMKDAMKAVQSQLQQFQDISIQGDGDGSDIEVQKTHYNSKVGKLPEWMIRDQASVEIYYIVIEPTGAAEQDLNEAPKNPLSKAAQLMNDVADALYAEYEELANEGEQEFAETAREDGDHYKQLAVILSKGKGKQAAKFYDGLDTISREHIDDHLEWEDVEYLKKVFGKLGSKWLYLEEGINLDAIVESILEGFPGQPKDYADDEDDIRYDPQPGDDEPLNDFGPAARGKSAMLKAAGARDMSVRDFEKDHIDPEIEDEELGLRFD